MLVEGRVINPFSIRIPFSNGTILSLRSACFHVESIAPTRVYFQDSARVVGIAKSATECLFGLKLNVLVGFSSATILILLLPFLLTSRILSLQVRVPILSFRSSQFFLCTIRARNRERYDLTIFGSV